MINDHLPNPEICTHRSPIYLFPSAGLMSNINPSWSHKDPKKRHKYKKFNTYFDETTIKYAKRPIVLKYSPISNWVCSAIAFAIYTFVHLDRIQIILKIKKQNFWNMLVSFMLVKQWFIVACSTTKASMIWCEQYVRSSRAESEISIAAFWYLIASVL